ncbi:MAG: EAL domain-containing protein [Xenococcus sp. (in: cyanobacteria)]
MLSNSIESQHLLAIDSPYYNQVISLKEDSYSIGRQENNTIIINSDKLSRKHATLVKQYEKNHHKPYFLLLDGDETGIRSTNGIWVNGLKCIKRILKHGDIIDLSDEIKATYYIVQSCVNSPAKPIFSSSLPSHPVKPSSTPIDYQQTQMIDLPSSESSSCQHEQLASIVELSPNPILELDWQGNLTYQNSAARLQFPDLTSLKQNHPLLCQLRSQSQNPNGNLVIREIKVNQQIVEQHIHYLPDRQLIRIYLFDITQRKQAEEHLHYQAFYDSLTGLPNRALFKEHLSLALNNAQRGHYPMAIFFLDLDRFKAINDIFGHSVGDESLKLFAQRLQTKLRAGDVLSRWGGDEFTLLLPRLNQADEPAKIAQRILQSLTEPFRLSEQEFYLKTSMGIALYPQDGETAETLIKNADSALYRSKEQGDNHYQFYRPSMTVETSERFQLETLLYQAIEREELQLYYQPQINIRTGDIQGMEALIRWQHPKLGLISPDKFIPIAEKTGLILTIDEWVLRTACQQNKAWQQAGFSPMKVAVNLSARQFQQPHLPQLVAQLLKETQLDPHFLEIEVTETALVENVELARHNLKQLRQLGTQIAMDDFGTGYSSLSYLKEFPFHTLKIDAEFVKNLRENSQEIGIISVIMMLGEVLNLKVIVEGVETSEQMELLKQLQCEEMQGYLFCRPLNLQQTIQFLAKQT